MIVDRQRPDVIDKYDSLYRLLASISGEIAADPRGEKYERLRLLLDAAWGVFMKTPFRSIDWKELQAHCAAYIKVPATWYARDKEHSGTREDYFTAYRDLVTSTLMEYLPLDATLIMELGAGWGRNIFNLAGVRGPAAYRAGDFSNFSKPTTETVASLFPGLDFGWFPFNFLSPDFPRDLSRHKKIGVFTVHAIEQVGNLGTELFDALFSRFPDAEIYGVHLEPVGFQFDTRLEQSGNRRYAEEHNYNLDLFDSLQSQPKITVTRAESEVLSTGRANSTSLLVWQRS